MRRSSPWLMSSPFPLFPYRHCDPRRLHSFPTRRSSDLSLITLHLGFDFNADEYKIMGLAPYGDAARLDRKSTRLNSSHRCISYAVFCLKKKKKQKQTARPRKPQHHVTKTTTTCGSTNTE